MDDALQALLEQERLLHFKRFDSEMAWRLGSALVEQAKREKLTLAVDISVVGHQVFHFACNGTSADNDAWLQRKAKTVLRFGIPRSTWVASWRKMESQQATATL